jgi:hypothetical protein
MASVNDYVTEKILTYTRLALYAIKLVNIPIVGDLIKKKLHKTVRSFEPALIDMKTASELIRESGRCAVGERVCRKIYVDSAFTESVFLNELAEGMVKAGKARYVTENDAISTLQTYRSNPIILSRVSGKYMEICRSLPETCIYWRMERCDMACLNRRAPRFRESGVAQLPLAEEI